MRHLAPTALVLFVLIATGCPGPSSGNPAPGSGSDAVPEPPAGPPPYRRGARLSTMALTETLYYPLDTCVVSGKKLVPHCHYVEVIGDGRKDGRIVRLYNETYVARFEADREAYLAKIDEAYKAAQRPTYRKLVPNCPVTDEPLGDDAYEFLLDPRLDWVNVLRNNMRYLPIRYTVSMRLIRVKDEAAAKEFQRLEDQVINKKTSQTRKVLPVGGKAMVKVIGAYIEALRKDYLTRHQGPGGKVACAVNGRPLGRAFEDPETGGYRNYLLGDQLFVVCCKSCMSDIRTDFNIQLGALAMTTGKQPWVISPLKDWRKLPPPPRDEDE